MKPRGTAKDSRYGAHYQRGISSSEWVGGLTPNAPGSDAGFHLVSSHKPHAWGKTWNRGAYGWLDMVGLFVGSMPDHAAPRNKAIYELIRETAYVATAV